MITGLVAPFTVTIEIPVGKGPVVNDADEEAPLLNSVANETFPGPAGGCGAVAMIKGTEGVALAEKTVITETLFRGLGAEDDGATPVGAISNVLRTKVGGTVLAIDSSEVGGVVGATDDNTTRLPVAAGSPNVARDEVGKSGERGSPVFVNACTASDVVLLLVTEIAPEDRFAVTSAGDDALHMKS